MSVQLCLRADWPFTNDPCDLESVRCVAYQKARDALTKHFNFVPS